MGWGLPSLSYCRDRREYHPSGCGLKGENEHTLCFWFSGFSPRSEILVILTHIHRNFKNWSWSKPLLGETKLVITHTGAQASLSQALDGGQVNESVTCCNPGPYQTTSGVWLKIYLVTCILSNSSMQWIYHKQLSPISQDLCFMLPLVASHGCYKCRYPITVPSATRLSGVVCHHGESCGQNCQADAAYYLFCCVCSICEQN